MVKINWAWHGSGENWIFFLYVAEEFDGARSLWRTFFFWRGVSRWKAGKGRSWDCGGENIKWRSRSGVWKRAVTKYMDNNKIIYDN